MSQEINLDKPLLVESSPQISQSDTTSSIMWTVTLCLVPAGLWGTFIFGSRVLLVVLVSVGAALLTELLIGRVLKRRTLLDGSAFLTGLLIAYNMPPAVPLYIPVIASVFALAVVKWSFGGLGNNWMNPALAGRVFVFFSWTSAMTSWTIPRFMETVDTATGASPLASVKTSLFDYAGTAAGPMEILRENGYPVSGIDFSVTGWINSTFGTGLGEGYIDLFIGNVPGSIGEVSAVLLLAGAVVLFLKKIITWEIPVAYLGTFSLLVWIFGGRTFGAGYFSGDILFHLFSGGLILGVFFMATDMVTSPYTGKGMLIFGAGAGFLTFLIRFYGSFPEGVSLAIILMNIFVPMINRYTQPRRFGIEKKRKPL